MKAGFTIAEFLFDLGLIKLRFSLYQAFCKMMALLATCRNAGTFSRYKHFGEKSQVPEVFKAHTFGFRHFLSRP